VFDFRYHALTLVAVFMALVIGLLLGVAVGDEGLVSGAERRLRSDLRADVEAARTASRDLQSQLDVRERYEDQTYEAVVGDRLTGRRVAVLTLHQSSPATFDAVREAILPAGGEVSFVGRLRLPPDLDALAGASGGTRFEDLEDDPALLGAFGTRFGQQLATGGPSLDDVRRQLFASSSGELEGVEAVVVIRTAAGGRSPEEAERELDFVEGLVDGLRDFETPLAGVERTDTEPSQIDWYRDRGIPSVDNVDQIAGRAALVLVLAGGGDGAYGIKSTAEALLPETLLSSP